MTCDTAKCRRPAVWIMVATNRHGKRVLAAFSCEYHRETRWSTAMEAHSLGASKRRHHGGVSPVV
jgi:hypothetical protein